MSEDPRSLLADAFVHQTCVQLVLSQPRQRLSAEYSKVVVRPIELRQRPAWQFAYHASRNVTHENLETRAALAQIEKLLARTFEQAALYTNDADVAIRARPDGTLRATSSPPTKSRSGPATHNREKSYLIPEGTPCPFLIEIGVMTPDGTVRRPMYHKFRQINRFLELIRDVIPSLPKKRPLQIVDFGCGKSYLTFALHHLLTEIEQREVHIVGLDRQPDVIRTCSDLGRRLGCAGLQFEVGEIAGYQPERAVDLVVSLHACDTATDSALAQGVRWESSVILAVPCCQHEIAPQLRNDNLVPLLKHGILRERFAALATDALRAALLNVHGYTTQVVEFIDLEHTPKNLLIRAVKRRRSDPARQNEALSQYQQMRKSLGIETFTLEHALSLSGQKA
jgi:SAM-dependent methyltransferase